MSEHTYFNRLWIISKVFWDKCYYTLFKHFDLFDSVQRIYPENAYYPWWHLLHEPSLIVDNLYLGSAFNAADQVWLEKNQIRVIINVTESISNFFPDKYTYYNFEAEDLDDGSLENYYENFISTVKSYPHDPILVHCYAGRSRSAALILYYLIKEKDMTLTQALEFLRSKRSLINLNQKFVQEIQDKTEQEQIFSTT